MTKRQRIEQEIEFQKSIEGEKCNEKVLLWLLNAITEIYQWDVFVQEESYPKDLESLETHRFYYPTEALLNLYHSR